MDAFETSHEITEESRRNSPNNSDTIRVSNVTPFPRKKTSPFGPLSAWSKQNKKISGMLHNKSFD